MSLADTIGALVVIGLVLCVVLGSVLGFVAFAMLLRERRRRRSFREDLQNLLRRLHALEQGEAPTAPQAEEPPVAEPSPEVDSREARLDALQRISARPVESAPERPARPGLDWNHIEELVGKRWMTWVGAVVLFFAAAFFVKYAFDRGWLRFFGPTARVSFGILAGCACLAVGDRFMRGRMQVLGEGLAGLGLAILYASLFAATSFYELIPQPVGFLAMALVTAAGMTLCVLRGAVSIAFLAVLGGFLTPVLLSTGEDARDALFAYVILLDLGVLGVALSRKWRSLDVLAFVGTAILYAGWFHEFYADAAMVPALVWLAAFFAVFLLLPFVHHLRRGTPITIERFALALANAGLAFTAAYAILADENRHVLGFVALGMAACYLVLGAQARRRISADARSVFGFIALTVFFLTLAVPLHLKLQGITLAWSLEAPLLLYLGYRYSYRPVRIAATVVLALVTVRLFSVQWPLHGGLFVPVLNRHFAGALMVPLAAGLCAFIHARHRSDATPVDLLMKTGAAIGAGVLTVILAHAELAEWCRYTSRPYVARALAPAIWTVGAACFFAAGIRARSLASRVTGAVLTAIALLLAAYAYGRSGPDDYVLFVNFRFLGAVLPVLAVFAFGYTLSRCGDMCEEWERRLAIADYVAAGVLLLILLSAEAYSFCDATVTEAQRAGWTALMSLSVVWAVYAAATLAVGFWKRVLPLRIAALALFGAAAIKVVLVDMAVVQQVYRIISFFVLGALMIGGAYLYHRIESGLDGSGEQQP